MYISKQEMRELIRFTHMMYNCIDDFMHESVTDDYDLYERQVKT